MSSIESTSGSGHTIGDWVKAQASRQDGTACVELAGNAGGSAIRDSKLGEESPVLHFGHAETAAFLIGAAQGDFDHVVDPTQIANPELVEQWQRHLDSVAQLALEQTAVLA